MQKTVFQKAKHHLSENIRSWNGIKVFRFGKQHAAFLYANNHKSISFYQKMLVALQH